MTGRRIKYDILVAWVGDGRSYHRERVQCETFNVTQPIPCSSFIFVTFRHKIVFIGAACSASMQPRSLPSTLRRWFRDEWIVSSYCDEFQHTMRQKFSILTIKYINEIDPSQDI